MAKLDPARLAEAEANFKEAELMSAEDTIVEEVQGDYWEKTLIFKSQIRGRYFFTNERIIFNSGWGINKINVKFSDIKAVRACTINLLIPTGVEITVANPETGKEKKYLLSLMKRQEWIDFIKKNAKIA